MTAKLTRPHVKTGRPPMQPPADAAKRIEAMSSEGAPRFAIGRAMGVSSDTFSRWLKEDPALREAFDAGRCKVELTLFNVLYQKAIKGDLVAAIYLTKAFCGWREGETQASAVAQVIINLPGALPMEKYVASVPGASPAARPAIESKVIRG